MKRIALITAHPDDESMFFTPTLFTLSLSAQIYLLCFSSGDYEHLGETRKRELAKCCDYLEIKTLEIIEDEDFKDGPNHTWNTQKITSIVSNFVKKHGIEEVGIGF
jgi:N-acetylglucosaminylphosphatidylinositol deacetylase